MVKKAITAFEMVKKAITAFDSIKKTVPSMSISKSGKSKINLSYISYI